MTWPSAFDSVMLNFKRRSASRRNGSLVWFLAGVMMLSQSGTATCQPAPILVLSGSDVNVTDSQQRTWVADTTYNGGEGFANPSAVISGTADPQIYRSMRYFGSQTGPINSYFFQVAAPAYYWVRLHFAEILYAVPAVRIFSVYIDGVNVLPNFTLPLINAAVTKEIYVPVTSSSLNVTFLRGALGDPMVNAIEVIQAYNTSQPFDDLYGLQPTSGQALATELRLICGLNSTTFGPDAEGRVWDSGSPAGSGVVITPATTEVLGVNRTSNVSVGSNIPPAVYYQARQLFPSSSPSRTVATLTYSLPAVSGSSYHIRLHFVELQATGPTQRLLSISVNGALLLDGVDTFARAGFATGLPLDFSLPSITNSTVAVSIASTPPSLPPMLSGLELFRVLNITTPSILITSSADPTPFVLPNTPPPATLTSQLAQGLAIGAAIILVLTVGVILWFSPWVWRKYVEKATEKARRLAAYEDHLRSTHTSLANRTATCMGTRVFTLEELQAATADFSPLNEIGKGGFGSVYKAEIGGGVVAAVKKLSLESTQGEREFLTEVELLSTLHHRHLVNLIGFCEDVNNLCLVYEYAPMGTLRDVLKDKERARQLLWPARLHIALGAARGLEYLHRGATPPVIHRDIKTTNILLDATLEAKVADFGLSRRAEPGSLEQRINFTHVTTGVKGTPGYVDPLYWRNNQLTEKSDVYSFGVVLLEILTGKNAIWREERRERSGADGNPATHLCMVGEEEEEEEDHSNLVEWALPSLESGDTAAICAPELQNSLEECEASMQAVAQVARGCVELQTKDRPTMSDVVRELELCTESLTAADPTRPPPVVPYFWDPHAPLLPRGGATSSSSSSPLQGLPHPNRTWRGMAALPLPRVLEAVGGAEESGRESRGSVDDV